MCLLLRINIATVDFHEMMFAVVTCFGVVGMKVLLIKYIVRTGGFCTNISIGRRRTDVLILPSVHSAMYIV